MRKTACTIILIFAALLSSCGNGRSPAARDVQRRPTATEPEATTETIVVPTEVPELRSAREAMVLWQIEQRGVSDPRVLQAMRSVPRHLFVPPDYVGQAYEDHPLPIGLGQTISQPYIVAWMTELLGLEPDSRVLEIGTGSGYQAAVLAEIVDQVYTIEIIPQLADSARERLRILGYDTIQVLRADGYWGWPEQAPFDAIIVTAAPDHVPQPLVEQLKPGGRLVIPIGPPGGYQSLWQFTLEESGLVGKEIGGVRFVPFVREAE
jgi:protein-L-isoaspartate(D-aspartate) O-methyltransferase